MKRLLLIVIAFTVISIIISYTYINKSHRDIAATEAEYIVTADQIFNEFLHSGDSAQQKYFDKVIGITGVFNKKEKTDMGYLILLDANDGTISGELLKEPVSPLEKGDKILIKGLFTGYDDLLNEIKLRECSIVE